MKRHVVLSGAGKRRRGRGKATGARLSGRGEGCAGCAGYTGRASALDSGPPLRSAGLAWARHTALARERCSGMCTTCSGLTRDDVGDVSDNRKPVQVPHRRRTSASLETPTGWQATYEDLKVIGTECKRGLIK